MVVGMASPLGVCPVCHQSTQINLDGTVRVHWERHLYRQAERCPGSGQLPQRKKPPVTPVGKTEPQITGGQVEQMVQRDLQTAIATQVAAEVRRHDRDIQREIAQQVRAKTSAIKLQVLQYRPPYATCSTCFALSADVASHRRWHNRVGIMHETLLCLFGGHPKE